MHGSTVRGQRLRHAVLIAILLPAASSSGLADQPPRGDAPLSVEDTRAEFLALCRELREGDHLYFGTAQLREAEARLQEPGLAGTPRVRALVRVAREHLRLGSNEEALAALAEALEGIEAAQLEPRIRGIVRAQEGLAQLRLAEVTNCVGFHSPEMCIFPIREGGRHPDPRAALAALAAYNDYLTSESPPNPDLDVLVRWLAIVAAMTAGRYPDGLPEGVRLPEGFPPEPEVGPGKFLDAAGKSGLFIQDLAGGGVMDDFDGDGLLDVVTSSVDPCTPLRFFRNDGKGGFEARAAAAGLDGQLGGQGNLVHADYDNDGHLDLLVLRGGWYGPHGQVRNSLLRNQGDGTFADVTFQAGVAEPACPTQTAAWADYDLDGDLDLYVGNEAQPDGSCASSQLFRNRGDGTFADVTATAGVVNERFAKAVAWGDVDNDGDPDLYVSNGGPNRLYSNRGNGTFEDVAPLLGLTEPERLSFTSWFFDYDNDGWLDLFVGNYSASNSDVAAHFLGDPGLFGRPRLYRNRGGGRFVEVGLTAGLTAPSLPMGANFGDLDNDGYLDFYLGTGTPDYEALMPNLMYWNDRGRRFVDVTYRSGFGHLQKGHGVAFGDVDNDGDQDVFQQMGGSYPGDAYPSVLYENPSHENRWIAIRFHGRRANRAAIGARVALHLETPAGPRSVHRRVGTGGSFGGSPLRLEVGLGDAASIVRLEVRWPGSGLAQEFEGVALDRFYALWEGDEELTPLDLPRLVLGGGGAGTHRHGG